MATPIFQYTSLYVRISEAKKIPSREMSHMRDLYCVLKVDNETIARTATAFRTLEPFWGEEYNLHVPNEFQNVSVHIYDHHDVMGSKTPLGKVMLDRVSILRSPRGIDKWFQLTPISKDDEVQGEVLVEMSVEPFSEEANRVLMTLVEARDLAPKGDGRSDPFATIFFDREQYSTQVMQKTRFPRWKKTFELMVPQTSQGAGATAQTSVKVVVYNFDTFSQNQFMGQVEIDLAELQVGQRYKTWYRLQHHEPKQKEKKRELGSLRLKVQCHEERILDSQLYTRFNKTMLKAVDGTPSPQGSPLLVMLEEVMTMDRNAMGHTLVRFYLAHGSVLPFLDALNMREIHQTTIPHTLFRGNSLATKSFDQFMKIVALPYLHETISPAIDLICTEHKVVELDVEQVKQNSKPRTGHLTTSSAMKTVESSILLLTNYLEMIMDAIFSSVDRCPSLLRMALRQLWLRVADRFQDPEHTDVPYLAITGFLFLRFFVPAILSPKLFALREEHSDQRSERTLKFIAKVLQSTSNLQLEMDVKEVCMKPMSDMLPSGVKRLKMFIQELVQIDQQEVAGEIGVKDGGYIHHLILSKGWLWKRSTTTGGVAGNLQYRKRFFELSNIALTYGQNEKKTGEVKSYPVQWIKVVEKLDEGAFHRKHMFQVVIVPSRPAMIPNMPSQITLYLQAADVNEQNKWVSAIRKACLTNRDMSPVYHPGAYKKTKWSCCRTTAGQEPGCSQCHRGITIGDWRDPLDPDLDSQVILSQYQQGKSALIKKFLGGGDDGSASMSTRDGSSSPTSLASAGTTSLQQDEESFEGVSAKGGDKLLETSCQELVSILDELHWQHSHVHVT